MSDISSKPQAHKDLTSGVWTAAERIISQISQLTVFIAAARILTPAEFGVFALTSACAILLLRFAEVGWAPYIMSWSGDESIPRQVLWIAMVSGLLVSILGIAGGQIIKTFGASSLTSQLVTLFSFWILLAATSTAQKGIMVWQHKLRSSAVCEIAGEVVGLLVALASLFAGYGVLALVFGRISLQCVHLLMSFSVTRLTPLRGMQPEQIRDLKDFSIQIFSTRMIINFRIYAATFIIGGFLGPAAVGFYRAGERLVGAVNEVVAVPSQVLAWSLFRRARDNHNGTTAGFQAQANSYYHVLFLAAVPVFIWVSVLAQDLIVGLLGTEWVAAAPIVAVLALSRVLIVPSFATEAVISLAGEIKRLPKFAFSFLIATVLLTTIAGPFGMVAVAWSQVVVAVVIVVSMMWLVRRYAAIDFRDYFLGSKYLILPIIVASGFLYYLQGSELLSELSPLVRVVAASVPTFVLYAIALICCDPVVRNQIRSSVHLPLRHKDGVPK